MKSNVILKAKRNIIFGVMNKAVIILCPFLIRTVIFAVFGELYLGLNSLFSSLFSFLSLSELGIGTAIICQMSRVLGDNNTESVNALLYFYKKAYRIIGFVILMAGLVIMPALPFLIKGEYPLGIRIEVVYLIALSNIVLPFFLYDYMTSLLVVHQRDDIRSMIHSIITLSMTAIQIVAIYLTRNYFAYIVLVPLFTVARSILQMKRIRREFPQYHPEKHEKDIDRKEIGEQIAGSFFLHACEVTRNSLDSICISAMFGLSLAAIYNNYLLIMSAVISVLMILINAFYGGIGSRIANESVDTNYHDMILFDFSYLWAMGWCAICMLCLFQPVMKIWMGEGMLLSENCVWAVCIYFFILKNGDIRNTYAQLSGLLWKHRFRTMAEAILNVILNILLARLIGVLGIILATGISLLLCNVIWGTIITFKNYFGKDKLRDYYCNQIKETAGLLLAAAVTYMLCGLVPSLNKLTEVFSRALICLVVPNIIMVGLFGRSGKFHEVLRLGIIKSDRML